MEVLAFGDGVNTVWFGQGAGCGSQFELWSRAFQTSKRMVTRYGRNHCIRTAKDDGFFTKLDSGVNPSLLKSRSV